ncbi:MAG: hypothetical protein WC807_06775 [Hyphomicrobium sp.]|jgi:hypothetical protein
MPVPVVLTLLMQSLLVPASATIPDNTAIVAGLGTVIIGGARCQLIALDDGRFVVLQAGALPNAPLVPRLRVKLTAKPVAVSTCKYADPVDVQSLQILIDQPDGK